MDIKKALIDEHSKNQTAKIVKFIGEDKSRFKLLCDIFFKGEYRLVQRAAWPLSVVIIQHPELIKPYFPKLIAKLNEKGVHVAVPRNILRIFQFVEIPEKYQGVLLDQCITFILDTGQPVAVRAFSITVAAKLCRDYEELKNELVMILTELKKYPQQPAINIRVREALKSFGK